MTTIEIARVEDVREGDMVTLAFEGHEFTGKAWNPYNEGLNVGGAAIRWYGIFPERTFIRATREVPPPPPTKPGSTIIGSGVSDDGDPFTDVALRTCGGNHWTGWAQHGLYVTIAGHALTAWTPARIVAEGDVGVAR